MNRTAGSGTWWNRFVAGRVRVEDERGELPEYEDGYKDMDDEEVSHQEIAHHRTLAGSMQEWRGDVERTGLMEDRGAGADSTISTQEEVDAHRKGCANCCVCTAPSTTPSPRKPTAKPIEYFGFIGVREALSEVATPRFWRDALCETVIVFFMVFGACMVGISFPDNPSNIVGIAMSGGLFVFVLIEGFAHIQLSCMNPCAIMVFVCTKRLSFIKGIAYFGFELAGSALASKIVYECTPVYLRDKIQPLKLGPDVTTMAGVTVEWVLTGMLVWVVLGALDHDKRKVYMPGLPIGITIGMGIFVADKYTGGALNPLIVFGPAVVSGNWKHQWVYWVGDIGGAANAIILYYFFTYDGFPFAPKEKPHNSKDHEVITKEVPKDVLANGTRTNAEEVKEIKVIVNGDLKVPHLNQEDKLSAPSLDVKATIPEN